MRVGIIQTYKPYFTSAKRIEHNHPVTRPDSFQKSEFDFDKEIDIFYSKLEKSMGIVTPQDVILKANKVSKKTGVGLDDVYDTMGILSQYSSYKSLNFIENILSDRNMSSIMCLPEAYLDKHIPISNVMAYICTKNFDLKGEGEAVMVDSSLLEILKNMDAKKRRLFKEYLEDFDIKPLYFENFDKGYNFLNQEKSFEDFTIDVLKQAKKYQKHNGKSIDYNVRYVLNGENLQNIKMLSGGGHIEVIRQPNISTPEKIADNLNPIIPSKYELKSAIDMISDGKIDAQKDILKFLNKTLKVITPKQYGKYLKDIHKQLLQFLSEHGKTMDDVYFVIPSVSKSFMPANYVYMKVNHIENPKYVFLPSDYDIKAEPVENLPDNAVAVIVDDCVLSGLSMKEEAFPYNELVDTLSKDKNIVFAPMISLSIGKNALENIINAKKRDDKFICGKLLPDSRMKSNNLTLVYDIVNNSHLTTSVIFPYMGPDFNCDELYTLYGQFLYSRKAQKISAGFVNPFTFS